jgi:hypothetical protein
VFGRSQLLSVEATKALRKGEGLTMDYGPDKLDNTLLLDYGVLDTRNPKVWVEVGATGWGGGGLQQLKRGLVCFTVQQKPAA